MPSKTGRQSESEDSPMEDVSPDTSDVGDDSSAQNQTREESEEQQSSRTASDGEADESMDVESDGGADDSMDVDTSGPSKKEIREMEKVQRRKEREAAKSKAQKRKANFEADNAVLANKKAADAQKRYAYLMGQTEIFSHFINLSKMKGADVSALEEATDYQKAKEVAKDGSRRHRKTEKEEDEEMLQTAEDEVEAEVVFSETPHYVKFNPMRDYQLQGLTWLISLFKNGINGILADEMGLGKTLQTISFLGYLKHFQQIDGPHVVIVPKSTLHNWEAEFNRWVPSIKAFMFHGLKDDRPKLVERLLAQEDWDVVITSYEMCLLEKSSFKKIAWQYIVIDEAHRIKNENSALSQIVREFKCRNRLLLTGTPLQNNLHELWALLNFLLPDIFSSAEDFDNWFEAQGGDQDSVVSQLHKVLRPFLLRRIKADVEKSLLPKKRVNIYVGMSTMQRNWYKKILEKDIDAVNGAMGSKKESKTRLQNIVMQLRKCCNHPYLFDGAEPGPPFTTDEHLVENAGKMVILDKLLKRCKEKGSRVLLFSQMSRVLDILEDYCVFREYEYCRIDGNTPHEDRVASIDEYNKPGSSKYIFLLTTRAGGLGINLATADTVIMYDNDWNPQVDLQAEDRAHRIGQKKQVVVFRFITENAIEERVIDRATQKLRLDQLVIQQGRAVQQAKSASKDELVSMIQHGAEDIFKSSASTISGDAIDDILQRSEAKTAELEEKYSGMGLDDLQNFSTQQGQQSVYEWEGEDFRNTDKAKAIGMNWIGPGKREKKKVTTYSENEYYRVALQTGGRGPSKDKAPKPKNPTLHDFQFWPKRLHDLQDREEKAYQREQGYKVTKAPDDFEGTDDEKAAWVESEQAKIDDAEPLTEKELAEKETLRAKGFDNWNRQDFKAFTKACEKCGRDDLEGIQQDMVASESQKTLEEVHEYSAVFWRRYKEIEKWEKIIENIEKGEGKLRQRQEIQDALTAKVKQHRSPLQQLQIKYLQTRGKNYTEEEDRFLLVMLEKFGYGSEDVYEKIRDEVRKSPLFRFDWFIKSRTAIEIQRRCTTLIGLISKEIAGEEEEEEKVEKGKRKAKEDGRGAGKKGKVEEEVKTPGSGRKARK
ncbi:hypothetical protein HK097_010430 [Rhizophlyctis rosea]|uniref:Chromatin-remodeling ATPase INO80 n=1 Tax=Rhizophlyctis rosea TaxID=64517 RepID=A0AAD5S9X0_9FUNG|nr:hypothetical protein HK097_010430 [Rhizophlyctis rosea]